mmetsp:Transcript_173981/g.557777  ORF Transcript_173981/g.557777 Transcript_173981/m.557777 type:complete len:221 (+) Transcript_173981:94-756(+)
MAHSPTLASELSRQRRGLLGVPVTFETPCINHRCLLRGKSGDLSHLLLNRGPERRDLEAVLSQLAPELRVQGLQLRPRLIGLMPTCCAERGEFGFFFPSARAPLALEAVDLLAEPGQIRVPLLRRLLKTLQILLQVRLLCGFILLCCLLQTKAFVDLGLRLLPTRCPFRQLLCLHGALVFLCLQLLCCPVHAPPRDPRTLCELCRSTFSIRKLSQKFGGI